MNQQAASRVWFITGASRGFGRLFTEAALAAGDQVVATARTPEALADLAASAGSRLVVLPLDVTDRDAVFATVDQAVAAFGRLDIVVNNAGYGLAGTIEEVSEAQARAILDTNFFGALWVCQAAVPYLRTQGSGHILQLSSISGLMGIPTMGLYTASKFALEGMSEALMQELAPFGVHVTLVEPRAYATDFMGASLQQAPWEPAYMPVRQALMARYGNQAPGDPQRVAEAVLKVVASDAPPARVVLGASEYDALFATYEQRMAEWRDWEHVSRAAG